MLKLSMVAALAALVITALPSATIAQTASDGNSLKEYVVKAPKIIWGGGDKKGSTYSRVFVPEVQKAMAERRLTGYKWGGPSEGSLENAIRVTANPTHVALCQADICDGLKGQMIPGTSIPFNFTTLQTDIGDECLYLITKSPHYTTWGHVVENAWDIVVNTGGEKSGSYGTLRRLMDIYPDLTFDGVNHVGGSNDIVDAVINGGDNAFGFMVMRPDPSGSTFEKIDDADLHFVPVIDFDLEGHYTFKNLKVKSGGLLGSSKYVDTACTTVQLITGDPSGLSSGQKKLEKRLQATIKRGQEINGAALKEAVVDEISSWSDYLDGIKEASADRIDQLYKASKEAMLK
ncbi:hypothetical protein N9L26_00580 [Candidatus Pacebacteria bacterium]|nr:hypothetical protein [Candidatus Paceibacterota bacterium]